MSDHVLIIAEAGVNHNGSLEIAKQLVEPQKPVLILLSSKHSIVKILSRTRLEWPSISKKILDM